MLCSYVFSTVQGFIIEFFYSGRLLSCCAPVLNLFFFFRIDFDHPDIFSWMGKIDKLFKNGKVGKKVMEIKSVNQH